MKPHFLLAISGVGLCVLSWTAWSKTTSVPAMIPIIDGYTKWTEATKNAFEMDPRVAMLCRTLSPSELNKMRTPVRGTQGPHAKKYIRVFVNDIAKEQMMTRKNPHFPVGSVIVKQKLPLVRSKGKVQISAKPELLTVMIKREAGYDEAGGDWQYMVTDGAGKQETGGGQVEACQNCHRPFAKTDYVVRSYLPKEVMAALRKADAATSPVQSEPANPERGGK